MKFPRFPHFHHSQNPYKKITAVYSLIANYIQHIIIFIKTLIKQHLQFANRVHRLNHGLDQGTGNCGTHKKGEVTVNYEGG